MNASESITTVLNFGLSDYLALQIWIRKQSIVQTTLILIALMFGVLFITGYVDGETTNQIVVSARTDWQTYVFIFLVAIFVCYGLPFLTIIYCWMAGKLPKKADLTISHSEIRYGTSDHQLILQWQSLIKSETTRDVFFIRTKSAILRLPKRAFTEPEISEIEQLIASNASAARSSP